MSRGYFITGTDTGVGKTLITAGLLAVLRAHGWDAVAIKPVQTGVVLVDDRPYLCDPEFYRVMVNLPYAAAELNLYSFTEPVSPHLAARLGGSRIDPEEVKMFCRRFLGRHEITLVEGAGGLAVPLDGRGFTFADLAFALNLPLIIVARAGVGTINHTVLTVAYARSCGLRVAGVVFNNVNNETGPAVADNPLIVASMANVTVLGQVPFLPGVNIEKAEAGDLGKAVETGIEWKRLVE